MSVDDSDLAAVEALLRFESEPRATVFPEPGEVLGDFVIEGELGRGAMGVVYAARQRSLDRQVALKVVPEQPGDGDPASRARREREARLAAGVRHECLVAVHAAGSLRGLHWVAMDLVEGTDLRDLLTRGAPDLPQPGEAEWLPFALGLLQRIARALAAAHAAGIVHRDVKPENVLVDRAGRAFLADFGLAREDHGLDATLTRGFVGTPRYASPEQLAGAPASPASDVFAFGGLAFEVIAGEPAFAGVSTGAVFASIAQDDPRWPGGRSVPRDLRAVVERCLEKRPADRYADGRAVADEFDRLLRFEPVDAVPRGALSRAWRRQLRRPGQLAAVGLAAVLGLLALAAWNVAGERASSLQAAERRDLVEAARAAHGRGDVRGALATLDELQGGPAEAEALALRGDLLLHAGDWDAAATFFAGDGAALSLAHTAARWAASRGAALDPGADVAGELPPDGTATPFDHARQARLLAAAGQLAPSAEAWALAVESRPDALPWRVARAEILTSLRRYDDALAEYRVASQGAPGDVAVAVTLSDLLRDLGRVDEAVSVLEGALVGQPGEPVLLQRLSDALAELPDVERALAVAEQLFDGDPDDGVRRETLARRLCHAGRPDDAEALLQPSVDAGVRASWLTNARACVAATRKDAAELERLARVLLDDHEAPLLGYFWLQEAQRMAGQLEAALASLQALEALQPARARHAWRSGQVLSNLGRPGEARAALERSLALDPDQPEASFLEARVLLQLDRPFEAVLACERALARNPHDPWVHYWMAFVWSAAGQDDVALLYLEAPLAEWPEWWDGLLLQALSLNNLGELARAAEIYETVLAGGDHPAVRADYAEVLDRLERDREAADQYAAALALDAELPAAVCGLGLLRLHSDDPAVRDVAAALTLLERAVALDPESDEYPGFLAEARALAAAHEDPDPSATRP